MFNFNFSTRFFFVSQMFISRNVDRFASDEYSIEDCDKKAHLQRAIEIAENVEPSPGFISTSSLQSLHSMSSSNLQLLPGSVNDANGKNANTKSPVGSSHWTMVCSNSPALRIMLPSLLQHAEDMSRIHSQVKSYTTLNVTFFPEINNYFHLNFRWTMCIVWFPI